MLAQTRREGSRPHSTCEENVLGRVNASTKSMRQACSKQLWGDRRNHIWSRMSKGRGGRRCHQGIAGGMPCVKSYTPLWELGTFSSPVRKSFLGLLSPAFLNQSPYFTYSYNSLAQQFLSSKLSLLRKVIFLPPLCGQPLHKLICNASYPSTGHTACSSSSNFTVCHETFPSLPKVKSMVPNPGLHTSPWM